MKSLKNKKVLILLSVFLIIITFFMIAAVFSLDSNNSIYGWKDFNKTMKKKYPFINKVKFVRNEISVFVFFELRNKSDSNDIEKAFNETRNYLLNPKALVDIQNEHANRYKYGFNWIYIRFDSNNKDEILDYDFYAYEQNDGSFSEWYLNKYNYTTKEINSCKVD